MMEQLGALPARAAGFTPGADLTYWGVGGIRRSPLNGHVRGVAVTLEVHSPAQGCWGDRAGGGQATPHSR